MKVKPENLKQANKVANVREANSPAAGRRNYWLTVHRLVTQTVQRGRDLKTELVLMTNDGTIFLEWHIPTEGPPLEMDVLVQDRPFDSMAKHMKGGSLEVTRSGGEIAFSKDQLRLPLREESHQMYAGPRLGPELASWEMPSAECAAALRFIAPFIDETASNADKSVATMYPGGEFLGGKPQRIAVVRGLMVPEPLSFKARVAKAVAEFLENVGDRVKVTIYANEKGEAGHYLFEDPTGGHRLVTPAEVGRFPTINQDLDELLQEVISIDRTWLLDLIKTFAGFMPLGSDRIDLRFRGEGDVASVQVYVPLAADFGTKPNDESEGLHRELVDFAPPKRFRDEDEGAYSLRVESARADYPSLRTQRVGGTVLAVNRDYLDQALNVMTAAFLKIRVCGRLIQIEDSVQNAVPDPNRPLLRRSIIMMTKQSFAEIPPDPVTPLASAAAGEPVKVESPAEAVAGADEGEVTFQSLGAGGS